MFRKSIPTKLFSTNVLFSCAKLQPIAINRSLTQYVINKNNFSNTLMKPQNPLIDNRKYFSTQNNKQEIIVIDKKYLSTQNNKHDNKNVDYYMNKYKYYVVDMSYYLLKIFVYVFGLYGILLIFINLFDFFFFQKEEKRSAIKREHKKDAMKREYKKIVLNDVKN